MKKLILSLLFFMVSYLLTANITAIFVGGGNIVPRQNTKIELVEEEISFFIESTFKVKLNYELYNHGDIEKVTIGFPRWNTDPEEFGTPSEFKNIVFKIDHKQINYSRLINEDTDPKPDEHKYLAPIIYDWYVFEYTFQKNQNVNIEIEYDTEYGQNGFSGDIASYLFGTGRTWYSTIKLLKINIHIDEDSWLVDFSIGDFPYEMKRIGEKSFEIILNDIEPEYFDVIDFGLNSPPTLFNLYFNVYEMDDSEKGTYDDIGLICYPEMLSKNNLLFYKAFFRAIAGYPCEYKEINDYFNENKIKPDKNIRNYSKWKSNIKILDDSILALENIINGKIVYDASAYIDYNTMYNPYRAFDGKLETGWLENKENSGIGEYLKITLEREIIIDEIKIAPGYFNPKWWKANNRIKKIRISINDKNYEARFEDIRELQSIKFDTPITFKVAKFTILEVYKSNKDDDTGISEIQFYNNGEKILLK